MQGNKGVGKDRNPFQIISTTHDACGLPASAAAADSLECSIIPSRLE
jgi:hypothetical protein